MGRPVRRAAGALALLLLLWCGVTGLGWGWQHHSTVSVRQPAARSPPSRRRPVVRFNPLDALSDEVLRESGNLAQNVGKLGFEGVKMTGTVIKAAAPVVGEGVKTAVDTFAPIVKDGVETAAPIVGKALKDGIDTATPVVEKAVRDATPVVEKAVRDGIDYATPAASAAANKAMDAIQPYIDAGQAVPDNLLRQAKDAAGAERVTAALETERATRSGVASVLRGAARLLDGDGGTSVVLPTDAAPSLPPPPPQPTPPTGSSNPLTAALGAQEKSLKAAVEAKRQQALAPIYKFEEDLQRKAEEFLVLSGVGLVGLGLVKRFLKPLEQIAQTTLLLGIGIGLVYGAATYGPKAVMIWRILNDDAATLADIAGSL